VESKNTLFRVLSESEIMLVLNEKVVREVLPMAQAIEAMKQAFVALSSGKAMAPLSGSLR